MGGSATLPFVRMFHGAPSEYLWEDDFGQVHTISQGEGGEQSDALMPLLFALGQHGALETTARTLRAGEFMFAFFDDIYFITAPNRVGAIYATFQEALWAHARIAIHLGKTKVWNASGIGPEICTVLERMARETDRLPASGGDLKFPRTVGTSTIRAQILVPTFREAHPSVG